MANSTVVVEETWLYDVTKDNIREKLEPHIKDVMDLIIFKKIKNVKITTKVTILKDGSGKATIEAKT